MTTSRLERHLARHLTAIVVTVGLMGGQLALLPPGSASAAESGTTSLVSAPDGASTFPSEASDQHAISADGRYVAFVSEAGLVDVDDNLFADVYRRDTEKGTTELVSVAQGGAASDGHNRPGGTYNLAISHDGSTIAFVSNATNLVAGDTNGMADVFVRDVTAGTTVRVNVDQAGAETTGTSGNTAANNPALSGDGRWIAFHTYDGLVAGTSGGTYVRDLQGGSDDIVLVSKASDGTPADSTQLGGSLAVSATGRFVVLNSGATNLVDRDTNGVFDVFLHDRDGDADGIFDEPGAVLTERVSVASDGSQGSLDSFSLVRSVSADGDRVTFFSAAPELVAEDGNGVRDVFLRERGRGVTRSVGLGATGGSISDDGRWVSYYSDAAPTGVSGTHAYVVELATGEVALLDVSTNGTVGNGQTFGVELSHDGTAAAFRSTANNLIDGTTDGNGQQDVFLRRRNLVSISASLSTISPAVGAEEVPSVPAGTREVDIAQIPVADLVGSLNGPEAAPVSKMPVSKMPVSKMPVSKMPVSKMPVSKMPLSEIPVSKMSVEGGWAAVLAGTALADVPLVNVTLQDVYDLDGGATLGALSIGEFAAAFPEVGLASIALGSTPVSKMPAEEVVSGGWCAFLASVGFPCPSDAAGYLASTSLIELDIQGVPVSKMPLLQIPVSKMDIAGSPIAEVPVSKMAVGSTPVSKMPLDLLTFAAPNPLGTEKLHAVSSDQTVLGSIFDCGKIDCTSSTATIADAEAAGAIRPTAVLSDLAPIFGTMTIGDLTPHFEDEVTFGILILSLLDLADYPWEALDLEALGVQDFAPSGSSVTYRLTIEANGAGSASSSSATVTMPDGFRYVAGSAYLETGSVGETKGFATRDPITPTSVSGNVVSFDLGTVSADVTYHIDVDARPGLTLGTFTSTAAVTTGSTTVPVAPSAPVTVTENWEDAATGGPNDAPVDAPVAQAGHVYVGHIAAAGDVDHYRIPAPPVGTRISVRLSNLASDNDLVMYRPVTETPPSSAPPRAAPLGSTPLADDGAGAHQAAETLDDVPVADIGAGPADISASRSGEEEVEALALTDPTGQHYTIQVSGFNDAVADDHYQMLVKYVPVLTAPACARTLPHDQGAAPASAVRYWDGSQIVNGSVLPTGTDAVLLVNQQRIRGTYGDSGLSTVMQALDAFLQASAALVDNPVDAAVVSVDAFQGVRDAAAAWDAAACVPEEANRYADAVNAAVRGLRTPSAAFDHLVLVGGDDVIPMARLVDDTTEANEDTYADVFTAASPLQAALLTRHILSDDPYGDLDPIAWLDRALYLPDMALGRLVESPAEIAGQLQQFVGASGLADPTTALTTGYDFLADGATLVDSNLGSRIPDSGRSTLIDETWTRSDLVGALLPTSGDSPDVASVNAHYDHYRALPAIGNATHDESDLFSVDDIPTTSRPLAGGILFSMGCHSGLSVPDAYIESANGLAEDWAQTYGDQRAIWIGNSGYGYGDTEALALSEQLMADLAGNLDGSMSVGEALMFAKHEYFGLLGVYGAYDEKVLQQPIFYGLPMYRIGTPTAPAATSNGLTTSSTALAGVSQASLSFDLSTSLETTTTDRGTYYTVAGETPQVTHFRPIQPRTGADVTVSDKQARGAIITSLTSRDVGVNPVFTTPTVDLASTAPEGVTDVDVFPANLLNVSTYEAPDGTKQRLVLIPGQYFADGDGSIDTGIQRLYEQVGTVVYYNDSPTDEHVRPQFLSAEATIAATSTGNEVTFDVTVLDRVTVGEPTPSGTVDRVAVMFKDDEGWHPLDLAQDGIDPRRWTGISPVTGTRTEYLVQAVDGSGNVGVTTNKGRLFDTYLLPAGQTEPPSTPQVTFSGTQAQAGWYVGDVTISASGADGVTYTTHVDGVPTSTASGDGVHLVEVRGSDASYRALTVGIDASGPTMSFMTADTVEINHPLRAEYRCEDPTSGIASCDGPGLLATAQLGTHSYEVNARNRAGLSTTGSDTYTVQDTVPPTVDDLQLSDNPIPASTGTTDVSAVVADTNGSGVDPETVQLLVKGRGPETMALVDGRYTATVGSFEPGVYAVSVRGTDGAGNVTESESQLLAVYDPDGGFVTGGGWIDSPAGAYRADQTLTGRANFGFVSKYEKGATTPSGRTEFQFKAGGFSFFSETYQWLVVSGHKAQYKGTGSVNGSPGYGFLLTAYDGQATGGDGSDRFRLKVWRLVTDEVVYDNAFAESDDIDETTPQQLGGGSIVIHTKKK